MRVIHLQTAMKKKTPENATGEETVFSLHFVNSYKANAFREKAKLFVTFRTIIIVITRKEHLNIGFASDCTAFRNSVR